MPGTPGRSGGARHSTRPDAKPRGPKPRGVRVELGAAAMQELATLAAAEGVTPETLAARWLGARVAAEFAAYLRERGIAPEEPPAEWGGGVL